MKFASLFLFALLASAAMGQMTGTGSSTTTPQSKSDVLVLPKNAAPAKELDGLRFMVGRWICVNPNSSVNEEHWTAPRGNSMVGSFRQVRRDGKLGFFEVSLVSVEKEGIRLRLRHLHGGLEVPENRKDTDDFLLANLTGGRAEFHGQGRAKGMTVTYRLIKKDQLAVDFAFPAGSREKPFTNLYVRENLAK